MVISYLIDRGDYMSRDEKTKSRARTIRELRTMRKYATTSAYELWHNRADLIDITKVSVNRPIKGTRIA